LRALATRDPLTGLLNRRAFERMLGEEEERAQRFGHPLALIMIDVDHFKSINDAHGHPAGDAVLREIAQRVAGQVRSVDRVARIGGEEFGLILVQMDRAAALHVAERIGAAVRSQPVRTANELSLAITVSAGVAWLPHHGHAAGSLIIAADKALYAAKGSGRDRVVAAE
jgi:diguanylate cyclase (GGDEF)-like protein